MTQDINAKWQKGVENQKEVLLYGGLVNNTTELKNFSCFKNCFQPATMQYTNIQFKSATIQIN